MLHISVCDFIQSRKTAPRSGLSMTIAALFLTASLGLMLLTGCGMGKTLDGQSAATNGAALQGLVHGGRQPIAHATVVLYAAGSTGYGLPGTDGVNPTVLDTTNTDGSGNFTLGTTGAFNYTCPASPNDQVYVVASGGDPGDGINANTFLMAGLGSCSALQTNAGSTFININEVSTVASVYALQQFMSINSSGGVNVGASPGNYQGLVNAFNTITNLENLGTGQAYTITPAYTTNTVPYYNSSTVPQARINTLADILASCVNTNGLGGSSTICSTLFTAATPSGGSAPNDTLQAMLNIAQNPGNNVATLAGLATSTAPFQPTLSTVPNDWLIGLTFIGGGLGGQQGSNYAITNQQLAIDAVGNIWVTAYDTSGATGLDPACTSAISYCSAMIAEFNNLGAPLTPATTYNSAAVPPTTIFGGYQPTSGGSLILPYYYTNQMKFAFDPSGNAWLGGRVEISAGLSLENYICNGSNCGQGNLVGETVSDASGNVWVSGSSGGGTGKTLYEYNSAGVLQLSSTGGGTYGNNFYSRLGNLVFDSTGSNLWGTDLTVGDIYRISASTGQLAKDYYTFGYKKTAIVADGSGNIYGCTAVGKLLQFNASSTTSIATNTIASGRTCNASNGYMVMDGLGHIWNSTNYNNGTSLVAALDEFTTTGAALSPLVPGYEGGSAAEGTFNFQFMAIDGSGNLWSMGGTSTTSNSIVEFVGLAAPVLTPTSLALYNGQVATRP